MPNTEETIEILKKLYKDNFNIDAKTVELMSNRDILNLTASGSSVDSISLFLDIEVTEIMKVNEEFYSFSGWSLDLDLNPYSIYKNMVKSGYKDYETFRHEIATLSPYSTDKVIVQMLKICEKFSSIEAILEEEWI